LILPQKTETKTGTEERKKPQTGFAEGFRVQSVEVRRRKVGLKN
jgi:hypothetical protein